MKSNSCIFVSNLFIIFLISSLLFSLSCDAAVNYQMTIQDPATNCLEWMANFYDLIMADLVLVLAVIFFLIATLITNANHHKDSNTYFSHSQKLAIFLLLLNLAGNFPIFMSLTNQFVFISFFSLPSIFTTLFFSLFIKVFFLNLMLVLYNESATAIAPKPKSLGEKIAGAARGLMQWVGDKIAGLFAPAKEGVRYFIEVLRRVILNIIPTLFLGGLLAFIKLLVICILLQIYIIGFSWLFYTLFGIFCLCSAKNIAQFWYAYANIFAHYSKICKCLVGPQTFDLAVRRAYLMLNNSFFPAVTYILYLINLWSW